MAKFINTRNAIAQLEELIKNAGTNLYLVSPYLKLSKDFKELLSYRNKQEKITTIIFGKQELNPDEMKFLQGLRLVILKYNENLHAKCYVNEDTMIITSLNLYEFSMANNKEMGVLIDKNDPADSQLFEEAFKEVKYILDTSQDLDLNGSMLKSAKPTENKTFKEKSTASQIKAQNGFCIRTGVEIPFNVEKPLSYDAYKKWSLHNDPNYPEKFCHYSGEPANGETSVSRPILKKNWKKAKETFNL